MSVFWRVRNGRFRCNYIHCYRHSNNNCYSAEILFLEQPEPVLAPLGTQVELTCRVAMGNRIVWIVGIPGGGDLEAGSDAISALSSRGIETEVSSAENREPTLNISGTVENNKTTVQCTAVNITNIFQRCDGDVVTIIFYGKTINIGVLSASHYKCMQVLPQHQLT